MSGPATVAERTLGAVPRGGVQRLLGTLAAPWRLARNALVRSLQARVIVTTLLLSALVTALVGWMLMRQVADGLVEGKRNQSIAQAQAGFLDAQQQLDAVVVTDSNSQSEAVNRLIQGLASRSGVPRPYEIIALGPLGPAGSPPSSPGVFETGPVAEDSVPTALRSTVEREQGTWWTYTTLRYADAGSAPAVAVGSQVRVMRTGQEYALFYLFSMADQEHTLSLVWRALLSAGLSLMVLVAAVAWLVTRQVVAPVRLARRIAERLAAGRLEERMHVRGEDDIARLGQSFNQMAASLQRQIGRLEDLSRVQRRFASDVSHELRTPLTTVRMAADVLHEGRHRFDPATARSAELLHAELDRFESLLTDLLEISRFDAGAAQLSAETVDLADVARRVAAAYAGLAERAGVTVDLVTRRSCHVEADVRRLERIVRNLVANAITYSRSAVIRIEVAADRDAAALTVRDWGIGLRSGEAKLVFNRFWRADPARGRNSGGTGLGLAIALEDAALHGGWLQAWGEPGQGAQFRLTMPRRLGHVLSASPLPLVPQDSGRPAPAAPATLVDAGTVEP